MVKVLKSRLQGGGKLFGGGEKVETSICGGLKRIIRCPMSTGGQSRRKKGSGYFESVLGEDFAEKATPACQGG